MLVVSQPPPACLTNRFDKLDVPMTFSPAQLIIYTICSLYTDVFKVRIFGDEIVFSAFLLPRTGSGVRLARPGVPSRSLVASAWHDAWNARLPTRTASSQTHSWAATSHLFSNFSWHIGHTLLIPLAGSGTGIYLGPLSASTACPAPSSCDATWSASTTSRERSQSYTNVSKWTVQK